MLDDDPNIIDRWNRGEIEMLVLHPASGGHGLNLQYGGHIQVWFGLTYKLRALPTDRGQACPTRADGRGDGASHIDA